MTALLENKVHEMEEAGLVEITSSSWNSPILCIKKKDNSIRVVNNYSSGLNDQLLWNRFPTISMRALFKRRH